MSEAAAFLEFGPFLKAFINVGLEEAAMEIERGVAEGIVLRAKMLVHVGGAEDPNAGETRDSLAVLEEGVDSHGPYIDVGSRLEKAFYEEFGSVHGPAVFFLRTSIAESQQGKGAFGVAWNAMHRPARIRSSRMSTLAKLTK